MIPILTGKDLRAMKRTLAYALATAIFAACTTQEKDFQTPAQEDAVFYATFEQPVEEGTRVYANEDLLLRWTADDRVSIFNKITYNQEYKFLGETGDNAGGFNRVDNAEFVTGNPISHVVSVYPYQASTKISEEEVVSLTLPAEQHYAENSFGLGANTMVSVSEDDVLQYKNVGGYLMLKLYGQGVSVSSITLKGNNGEKLAGKATVSMPLDGVPTAVMADDATDEITLICDTPVALGATAEESTQFWFVVPPVTFSKGFTITVFATDGDCEKSTGKTMTIERNKLAKMSPLKMVLEYPRLPVPQAIDLGLPSGIKWASFNLGASKPEEYGDYYAWGETQAKTDYDWSTYKWCKGDYNTLTKYCTNSSFGYNGFVDGKEDLEPADDAARVNLGRRWRIPGDGEWTELRENCTWTWTTRKGIKGCLVTGSNGNSIFLPAAGGMDGTGSWSDGSSGFYWYSSINRSTPYNALANAFRSSDAGWDNASRYFGCSIRPVSGIGTYAVKSVSLDQTSLSLPIGETATLTATVSPSNAADKTVTWSSSDPSVATVDEKGTVLAVKEGNATITAKAGDKTATCAVTVTKAVVAVTSVTLNYTSITLNYSSVVRLSATVYPDNATDKTVTWSSSNAGVVYVTANGLVSGVREGSATITAKAGDASATCFVFVTKQSGPSAISVTYYGCQVHSDHTDINIYADNQFVSANGYGVSTLMKNWTSAKATVSGISYILTATNGASFTDSSGHGNYYWTWSFKNTTVSNALSSASTAQPVIIILTDVEGGTYYFVFPEKQSGSPSYYPYAGPRV